MDVIHKVLVDGANGVRWRLAIELTWHHDDMGSSQYRVLILQPDDPPLDVPWLRSVALGSRAEAHRELDRLANLLRGTANASDA
jgi:hypothetical protein